MIVEDFRVKIGFYENRKVKKLTRLISKLTDDKFAIDHALICLQKVWRFATVSRTDGILHDITDDDLVTETEYHGPGDFVALLLDCRFLKRQGDGTLEIHDWEENQPYVYQASDRYIDSRLGGLVKAENHRRATSGLARMTKAEVDQMRQELVNSASTATAEYSTASSTAECSAPCNAGGIADGNTDSIAESSATAVQGALVSSAESTAPFLTIPNHTTPKESRTPDSLTIESPVTTRARPKRNAKTKPTASTKPSRSLKMDSNGPSQEFVDAKAALGPRPANGTENELLEWGTRMQAIHREEAQRNKPSLGIDVSEVIAR